MTNSSSSSGRHHHHHHPPVLTPFRLPPGGGPPVQYSKIADAVAGGERCREDLQWVDVALHRLSHDLPECNAGAAVLRGPCGRQLDPSLLGNRPAGVAQTATKTATTLPFLQRYCFDALLASATPLRIRPGGSSRRKMALRRLEAAVTGSTALAAASPSFRSRRRKETNNNSNPRPVGVGVFRLVPAARQQLPRGHLPTGSAAGAGRNAALLPLPCLLMLRSPPPSASSSATTTSSTSPAPTACQKFALQGTAGPGPRGRPRWPRTGRLPLHLARLPRQDGNTMAPAVIVPAGPGAVGRCVVDCHAAAALRVPDPVTGRLPFQMAAAAAVAEMSTSSSSRCNHNGTNNTACELSRAAPTCWNDEVRNGQAGSAILNPSCP